MDRATALPAAGAPILAFDVLTDIQFAQVRATAAHLAIIHGVSLAGPAAGTIAASAAWGFSDTVHGLFSAQVPVAVAANPNEFPTRGDCGLVFALDASAGAEDWTT